MTTRQTEQTLQFSKQQIDPSTIQGGLKTDLTQIIK